MKQHTNLHGWLTLALILASDDGEEWCILALFSFQNFFKILRHISNL